MKNSYEKTDIFFKIYRSFMDCAEMKELINTSQIGFAAYFFLTVIVMNTIKTDGILYKYDDADQLVPLTNKDISNWFVGYTDFNEKTCAMYVNLLVLNKLLYLNKFGCLTVTNFCYLDDNEPALHSVKDASAKLKLFGVWTNDRRPNYWKTKYNNLIKLSNQQSPLEIEMDYSDYISIPELREELNLTRSTFSRYTIAFQKQYPDAVISINKRSKAFKKSYIPEFKKKFDLCENQKKNEVGQSVGQSMGQSGIITGQLQEKKEGVKKPHKYAEIEDGTIDGTITKKLGQSGTIVGQSPIDIKDTYYYDDDIANDDDDTYANHEVLRYVYSLGFSSEPSQEDLDRLNKLIISNEYDFSTIIKKLKDINGKAYTYQYLVASLDNLKTKKMNPSDPNYLGYWNNEQELNKRLEYIALSTEHPHILYGEFDKNLEKIAVVTMLRFWTAGDVKTAVDELDVYKKEINFENLDLALKHKIPYEWMIELKESQDDNRN